MTWTVDQAQVKIAEKKAEFEAEIEALNEAADRLTELDAEKITAEVLGALKTAVSYGTLAYSLANELGVLRNAYGIHDGRVAKPTKAKGIFG